MCSGVFKLEEGENDTFDAFKVIFLIQIITAYKRLKIKQLKFSRCPAFLEGDLIA